MDFLNLGCGSRYHPEWTNVDFCSRNRDIIGHNLREGIPFSNASFDVVYHSHVLEHFPRPEGETLLKECWRVLRPGGILRVVVPDLEEIVQTYLRTLEGARTGSKAWSANYEWILLEMYDQAVRDCSGGEMAAYLLREHIPNESFVLDRIGLEGRNLMEAGRRQRRLSSQARSGQLKLLVTYLRSLAHLPRYGRELLFKMILGREYEALQSGRFRNRGEVHLWMYDDYSLSLLLETCHFNGIIRRTAIESYVPEWTRFNLDTEPDGTVYKPQSLFMEAIKPER